jgi:predicted aconitase
MLHGEHGVARQKAMERLVRFGQAVEAERMVSIRSAHIFCDWELPVSIGAWPIYEEFVGYGARLAVPTTVENAFITEDQVDREGMPWNYKPMFPPREVWQKVEPVWKNLEQMGATMLPNCVPYLHLSIPRIGEYHAWIESNAACYANSMLGARINRDPGNIAFYAAIAGVIPEYLMHLGECRRGQMIFEIDSDVAAELDDLADYAALAGAIGFKAMDRVPVIVGLKSMTTEQAKAFCACASPAMTYPMLHVVGITPEAPTLEAAFGGSLPEDAERVRVGRDDLRAIYEMLRQAGEGEIQGAVLGCPLLTLQELKQIDGLLNGREVKVPLWLYCDSMSLDAANRLGLVDKIEATGARLVHSSCPGMAPRNPELVKGDVFATDSLKTVRLFSGAFLPRWWFGQRKDVVEAAISGRVRCTRWS